LETFNSDREKDLKITVTIKIRKIIIHTFILKREVMEIGGG
jgi:hypothetical protein